MIVASLLDGQYCQTRHISWLEEVWIFYIIHLDVYLLWSFIISVIPKVGLVKLWWTITLSLGCLTFRLNISIFIFVIYVIQCLKRISLIMMCLVGLHKWSVWLHKWLIWFYCDVLFDILLLVYEAFRYPIPTWALFCHILCIELCILYFSCCYRAIGVWIYGVQDICDLFSLKFHSWKLSRYI